MLILIDADRILIVWRASGLRLLVARDAPTLWALGGHVVEAPRWEA